MESYFSFDYRVTYGDCTAGNHVYYGRYLYILEEARGALFRSLNVPFLKLQELDTIFPVVECRFRYKSPARYDDLLRIRIRAVPAGSVRLVFQCEVVHANGAIVLEGETMHACTSIAGKPKRLPQDLLDVLTRTDALPPASGGSIPEGRTAG